MALRVLLADESSTIKKVFQLVLQDYSVEVNAVTIGLDVVPVALKFRPDIVFADVLLQKRNGYDVCLEIKNHPELKNVPVVMIWSGFMELDEAKYRASGANAHLEKPFDTQKLRQLVQKLVAKTQSQPLSSYLTFPTLPDFADERPRELGASAGAMPPPLQAQPDPESDSQPGVWSMENFDPLQPPEIPANDADEFISLDLPPPTSSGASHKNVEVDEPDEAEWVQKSLANFKMPKESDEPKVKFNVPPSKSAGSDDAVYLDLDVDPTEATPTPTPTPTSTSPQPLNEAQLEAVIRAQSQEVIEKVVWQILPEIATRIVERELQRLLKERKEQS